MTDIQDPAGNTVLFTYDSKGNIKTYQDPAGYVTTYTRDASGNITEIEDPLHHKTTLTYDAYNQLESVKDATNVSLSFHRDTAGNILTLTDTLGNSTTFSPDNIGQVLAITDPLGHITDFEYDANGNQKKITDPLGRATSYTHNFRGQLTGITDATGKSTILSYQPGTCCGGGGEKLTSITDPAGSISYFSYDQRGTLIGTQDPLNKTTSLDYDIVTRIATRTDRLGDALIYAYSLTGKLLKITYPDQTTASYSYNENTDWLTGMQNAQGAVNYTYNDPRGYVTDVTDALGFTLHFEYDGAGNLTTIRYPDLTEVTYGYDNANRLQTVTSGSSQATYGYVDPNGSITGRLQTFTQFNGISTSYAYDDASRLSGITSLVASYQFTLDAVGNRTASTETVPLSGVPELSTTSYTYNTRKNRLLSSGGIDYGYDDEGQLASAGGTTLTFDCDHQLTEISDANSTDQFFYDARGFRIKAIRNGVETRYIYDPWGNLLAEADASNQITRKYIYGKGLIALVTPTDRYCYHFDATGHTIALTDMAGTVVNSYAYEPFGQILAEQETIAQPFKYVGQYGVMAEPSGLYYMRARYYDPSVGRFISEDPIGFAGGDVNLSAYVFNDPVNLVDPLGLFFDQSKIAAETGTHILVSTGTTYILLQKLALIMATPAAVATAAGGAFFIAALWPSSLSDEDLPRPDYGKKCPSNGAKRSSHQKSKFLRQLAESGKAASWMNQWLKAGLVPPGYEVDHIIPLSIGGAVSGGVKP